MPHELVVGVIFPAKKIDRLQNVLSHAADGVRFVLIDLYDEKVATVADLSAKYGRLDAVLHKLAHEMVFSALGDNAATMRLQLMERYVAAHPGMAVIDPFPSVRLLIDRAAACRMLESLQLPVGGSVGFKVPTFQVVRTGEEFKALQAALDQGTIHLPLICKAIEACATDRSHLMSVITKREDVVPLQYPCLYQEFVNHSGRLFKAYVLGDLMDVAERRSLPNLRPGASHVHFNTQEPYPTIEDFHQAPAAGVEAKGTASAPLEQSAVFAKVKSIGERIREELKLSLFGFDVIVSDESHELYVIDVNYFPSYKEVTDFDQVLRAHIRSTVDATNANRIVK